MPREGARRRWATVAVVLVAVVSAPRLAAALPADTPDTSVADLLNRVRASDSVAYTGYAESVGRLPLPDAGPLDQVADLLGDRSRLRVWWASPQEFRVDALGTTGERDTYQSADRAVQWDSGEQRVRTVLGPQTGVRVPQPADLLPAALGRRLLAAAAAGEVRRTGSEQVGGGAADVLVVTPKDPGTLVGRIEVAVDAKSGVPLRVAVTARGSSRPAVETQMLDFAVGRPDTAAMSFTAPPGASTEQVRALDVGSLADRVAPVELPPTLAGLPRRNSDEAVGGARTYGTGYAVVAVVPLFRGTLRRLEQRLTLPGATAIHETWGEGQLNATPLLTAMTLRTGDRGYVIVGTVPGAVLESVAKQLAASPPPPQGAQ